MIELEKPKFIRSPQSKIEKVLDKWIVGYLKCPNCGNWVSIGSKEIDEDGKTYKAVQCRVATCRFTKYYKLKDWKNS